MNTIEVTGKRPNDSFTVFLKAYVPFTTTIHLDFSEMSQKQVENALFLMKKNLESKGCIEVSVCVKPRP